MRRVPPIALAALAALLALEAVAATPNEAALRAQAGREVALPAAALDGMFEGQFLYLDGRDPGPFTIGLRADGPGRWTGNVRDAGGPQAKVVATFDGLTFQMSKQYGPNRPEGYSEWVYYVGTVKHDATTGDARIVGAWSIPGNAADWGFFEIVLGR
jgi:hypothetical protein